MYISRFVFIYSTWKSRLQTLYILYILPIYNLYTFYIFSIYYLYIIHIFLHILYMHYMEIQTIFQTDRDILEVQIIFPVFLWNRTLPWDLIKKKLFQSRNNGRNPHPSTPQKELRENNQELTLPPHKLLLPGTGGKRCSAQNFPPW